MKRVAWASLGVVAVAAIALGVLWVRFEPTAPKGAKVGPVSIGEMTRDQARFALRTWWEQKKLQELKLSIGEAAFAGRPSQFGITLDDAASVSPIQFRPLGDVIRDRFQPPMTTVQAEVRFKTIPFKTQPIEAFVQANVPPAQSARAYWAGVGVRVVPEVPTRLLDRDRLKEAALSALANGGVADLPLREAPKKVADADLRRIREVVAQYTTRFSEGNRPRSHNIRLAAEAINGVVLAPGESFSFNRVVGRRSPSRGYREAGVFVNGRLDTGFGGGVCQVSTTLYNAALYSNLKVTRRSSHSLPVPYVPLGRDAAVDYDSLDLAFLNTLDHPIALSATVARGAITFRVLGSQKDELDISIVAGAVRTWANGVQTIKDPSLPRGTTRVVEGGAPGRSLTSYRVVMRGGQEIAREALIPSSYRGSRRVVAVGTSNPVIVTPPTEEIAPPLPPEIEEAPVGG